MSRVDIAPGESLEKALRRFKKKIERIVLATRKLLKLKEAGDIFS